MPAEEVVRTVAGQDDIRHTSREAGQGVGGHEGVVTRGFLEMPDHGGELVQQCGRVQHQLMVVGPEVRCHGPRIGRLVVPRLRVGDREGVDARPHYAVQQRDIHTRVKPSAEECADPRRPSRPQLHRPHERLFETFHVALIGAGLLFEAKLVDTAHAELAALVGDDGPGGHLVNALEECSGRQ